MDETHNQNEIDVEWSHWPKSEVLDWEDTALLQLPSTPELSPTTVTKVYSVRHSLNLVAAIIGRKNVSETMKIKGKFEGLPFFFSWLKTNPSVLGCGVNCINAIVNVKITGPRPPQGWNPVSVKERKLG